jgi:hypothetical protein
MQNGYEVIVMTQTSLLVEVPTEGRAPLAHAAEVPQPEPDYTPEPQEDPGVQEPVGPVAPPEQPTPADPTPQPQVPEPAGPEIDAPAE